MIWSCWIWAVVVGCTRQISFDDNPCSFCTCSLLIFGWSRLAMAVISWISWPSWLACLAIMVAFFGVDSVVYQNDLYDCCCAGIVLRKRYISSSAWMCALMSSLPESWQSYSLNFRKHRSWAVWLHVSQKHGHYVWILSRTLRLPIFTHWFTSLSFISFNDLQKGNGSCLFDGVQKVDGRAVAVSLGCSYHTTSNQEVTQVEKKGKLKYCQYCWVWGIMNDFMRGEGEALIT